MTSKGIEWTKARYLNDLIKPGDVILVEVQSVDEATRTARVNLDQEPAVEGAFIAVDVATGQIKAMVGVTPSSAASSTGPPRPCARLVRPSSRFFTRPPWKRASPRPAS